MKDELKHIAPELSKIKKEKAFKMPENYFDDFSARLHTKIEMEKQPVEEQKPRIIQLLKPALGLVASFAIIMLLVYVPLKTFVKPEINGIAETSETEDTDFLNVLEDMDEYSFFAALGEAETNDEFTDTELVAFVSANFSDYEIFENLENE